ncbi:MAG: hypothetical protein ABIU18_08325 [Novosphingobium sp.]
MLMLPMLIATLAAVVSLWVIVSSIQRYAAAFRAIRRELANGGPAIKYRYTIRTLSLPSSNNPAGRRNSSLPELRMKRANGLRYSTAAFAKAA